MPKVVLTPLTQVDNSSFIPELNAHLQKLANEFEKVVYRDGSFDITDHLNMNSKRIYNLSAPVLDHEPLRYADIPLIRGAKGDTGPPGPQGAPGINGTNGTNGAMGPVGPAPVINIGSVQTVSNATPADVEIVNLGSGTYALNFKIPMGQTGSGASVAWGGISGTLSNQTDLQDALNARAPLASSALTGAPTTPTAPDGTNNDQIASTGFVHTRVANELGVLSNYATTASVNSLLTNYVTSASLASTLNSYAPKNNAAFTGSLTINGVEVGFRGIPQLGSNPAALSNNHNGGHILFDGAAGTFTINNESTTPLASGFSTLLINNGTGARSIARGSGVVLIWAGVPGSNADRVLPVGGMATLVRIAANVFIISGAGLT